MKERIEKLAFVLLIIGTFGLISGEFAFSFGRIATLAFAVANLIGVVALVVAHRIKDPSM